MKGHLKENLDNNSKLVMGRYRTGFSKHSKCKGPEVTMYLALSYTLMTYYLPSPGLGTEDSKMNKILSSSARSSQYMEHIGDKHTVCFNVVWLIVTHERIQPYQPTGWCKRRRDLVFYSKEWSQDSILHHLWRILTFLFVSTLSLIHISEPTRLS